MEEYIRLLRANKNLILTGAPGTGKTYLAKQIAMRMIGETNEEELEISGQYDFVQFHPSYDYTDFVEGLRPVSGDDDSIGFTLGDGIFKRFCKQAQLAIFDNFEDDDVTQDNSDDDATQDNFNEAYSQFVDYVRQHGRITIERENRLPLILEINRRGNLSRIGTGQNYPLTKYNIRLTYQGTEANYLNYYNRIIIEEMRNNFGLEEYTGGENNNQPQLQFKPFVFVIDEINRGEISKIFGELFFSIDPGYRGIKGGVKTQYANMHADPDEKFYVPENVYIIGTMNDIDRSVESFDFAMRRRFTWKEITAEKSAENMGLSPERKMKMKKLNKAISDIVGLNSSYHIGGAYFLDNGLDFVQLWELRLQPLLKEYLRGMSDSDDLLKKLKEAYDLENNTNENNG
jgi:hypothetical protein